MKKVLLILLSLLTLPVVADVKKTVTFDFTNPQELNFQPALTYAEQIWLETPGDNLMITNKKIIEGDVTMSFSKGDGHEGVAINLLVIEGDAPVSAYSLCLRSYGEMTFTVPDGYILERIAFDGYMANVLKVTYLPGLYNTNSKIWDCNGSETSSMTFANGKGIDTRINTITVTYTRPSTPLVLLQTVPKSGDELKSGQSITLEYNTPIKSINDTSITLSLDTISIGMTAKAAGNIVTLSPNSPVITNGEYTLTVPAGCFTNTEDSPNDAFTAKYKFRKLLTPPDISPVGGSVRVFPDTVKLTFDERVVIAKDAEGWVSHNNTIVGRVTLSQKKTPSPEVLLSFLFTTDEVKEGAYAVVIPAGCIHNIFYSTSSTTSPYDSWNSDISLVYIVEVIEPEELKAAKALVVKTGVGYPEAGSEGRTALLDAINAAQAIVNAGGDPDIDELKSAMGKFYTEKKVQMPQDSLWYTITGVNNANSRQKVYLTYVNDSVRLTTDRGEASAFQAIIKEDSTIVFRTADRKRFLHVLTARENLLGASAANVSSRETWVNKLTLTKLLVEGADSTQMLGLMTLTGTLPTDSENQNRVTQSAAINYADLSVIDSEEGVLYFDEVSSSAFIIEPSSVPYDPLTSVWLDARFEPSYKTTAGGELKLVVLNVNEAKLTSNAKPYFMFESEPINYEDTILIATEAPYTFDVNTAGLKAGHYLLVLPKGTFTFVKRDKEVSDTEIKLDFDIISGSGDNSNPDGPDNPDNPDTPSGPVPNFQYRYNSQFACWQELERIQNNIIILPDTALNELILFCNLGNPYDGMYADSTKVVKVQNFFSGKVYKTGHFFAYPEFGKDYGIDNTQAVRLVLDSPIQYGEIGIGQVCYIIPKGTIGDANFGRWLQDHNSVAPEDCIANDEIADMMYLVNNELLEQTQGIQIVSPTNKNADVIYDLRGRRVAGQLKPGVYIINGHKRVVR